MARTSLRAVPDTNILVASEMTSHSRSPNREFFARWRDDEFEILYSDDTLLEYIDKLRDKGVPEASTRKLIRALLELGCEIQIVYFHFPQYPIDPDDIAFLLCAENGDATHIVTYDRHLQALDGVYGFSVSRTTAFLSDLRQELADLSAEGQPEDGGDSD